MKNFTCQCSRCDGTGRHDRGTCFRCNGAGYQNSPNTLGLSEFVLTVRYENGTTNTPRVFASSRDTAVNIIRRAIAMKGWLGVVE